MCINEGKVQQQPQRSFCSNNTKEPCPLTDQTVGVLTYDMKHRKTYDTLCLLKAKGYHKVHVYAQPLHYRKQFVPLIKHRPELHMDIPELSVLCENLGYALYRGKLEACQIPGSIPLLVCGSGILPDDFVQNHTIINAHPGFLPTSRGLDAFKWAIWEGKPLGVTTHILGKEIDAGEVIERREIKAAKNETFFETASRVYENETSMLVDAIEHLGEEHMLLEPGNNEVHRRMPHNIEVELLKRFDELKKRVGGGE